MAFLTFVATFFFCRILAPLPSLLSSLWLPKLQAVILSSSIRTVPRTICDSFRTKLSLLRPLRSCYFPTIARVIGVCVCQTRFRHDVFWIKRAFGRDVSEWPERLVIAFSSQFPSRLSIYEPFSYHRPASDIADGTIGDDFAFSGTDLSRSDEMASYWN
ncbi:hypothetical protein BDZ89DRAFT_364237 [Hymenopellis radicata]|nr:hypothetical protein BDZ89DRAFT_364237 [Hymenopellis radicata]